MGGAEMIDLNQMWCATQVIIRTALDGDVERSREMATQLVEDDDTARAFAGCLATYCARLLPPRGTNQFYGIAAHHTEGSTAQTALRLVALMGNEDPAMFRALIDNTIAQGDEYWAVTGYLIGAIMEEHPEPWKTT